jgi:prevent-host-death family protein
MGRSVSATEARIHFGDLLQRVANGGEPVIVERGGVPQAVVLSIAEYERLSACAAPTGWRDRARAARDLVRVELGTTEIPRSEDVIRALREERDRQLDGLR